MAGNYSHKVFTLLSLTSELQPHDYLVRATFGKTILYTQKIEGISGSSVVGVQKVCQRNLCFSRGICDSSSHHLHRALILDTG